MPYKVDTSGLTELGQMLRALREAAPGVAAKALYDGAGIVADAVSRESKGIRTSPFKYAYGGAQRKPSPEEKAILETAGVGIAKFRKNGVEVNTVVGYDDSGYVEVPYKPRNDKRKQFYRTSYKSQGGKLAKAAPQIANAINSGTSFMQKDPFFRRAERRSQRKATETIEQEFVKNVEEIAKENGGE